jgi:hypothetical protein
MQNKFPKLLYFLLLAIIATQTASAKDKKDFYEIKIYQLRSDSQIARVDSFLKDAYLPALHKAGIEKVGVFKPIANDTAKIKLLYVFIPLKSLEQFYTLPATLEKDATLATAGKNYWEAAYKNVPYQRMETVLLEAFPMHPNFEVPALTSSTKDKVYELRSYEGPTEKLYASKVKMFNAGGEIALFKRLGFNAVFYASVLAGSHQPNLMYMTSFENMEARNAHWKTFGSDPEWKKLSAMPEYLNTVSYNDTKLCHATDYSDF